MSTRARSLFLALAVAGCGGSADKSDLATSPVEREPAPVPPRAHALDVGCGNTFEPGLSFLGGRHWRRRAARVGAITIVRADLIGAGQTGPKTFISKLPILLRPDVRASLDIDFDHRHGGGFFVDSGGGLISAPPSQGRRRVYVGPCPRIPPEAQPDTPETGMGLFITTTRPGCATLTVRWNHHRRTKRVRLGVRRCDGR